MFECVVRPLCQSCSHAHPWAPLLYFKTCRQPGLRCCGAAASHGCGNATCSRQLSFPMGSNSHSQWEATIIPNGKQRPRTVLSRWRWCQQARFFQNCITMIVAEPRERPQHGPCAWRHDGRAPSSTVWRSPRRRRRRRRGPPAADALPPRRRGCAGVQQILNPNSNRLVRVHLAFSRRPIKATRVCPRCAPSTEIRFLHMTGCAAARSRAGDGLHRSAGDASRVLLIACI